MTIWQNSVQSFLKTPSRSRLHMLIGCLCILALILTTVVSLQFSNNKHSAHAVGNTPGNMPVGLNVDINEQSLTDLIANDPRIQAANGGTLTEDSNGWPSSDFEWVLDNRYFGAWFGSSYTSVDPAKFSTDLSGTYTLVFTGQATLSIDNAGDPAHSSMTINSQSYDPGSNTTTASVTFGNPPGGLVGGIVFTSTQRNPGDSAGDGVTNLHLWRPGYTPGTSQVFTDLWLNSIKNYNWSALRFMGALGTNNYANPTSPEVYPYRLQWNTDRLLPTSGPAYQSHVGVHTNITWENVVQIAQLTHKDIWINIPINASDDYVQQLANLMKNGDQYTGNQGIPDDVNIYLEYSNEIWNPGFIQDAWNIAAAKDEVNAGGSNLNYDGSTDNNVWANRRRAEVTIKYGNVFKQTFGDNGTRIRPVLGQTDLGNGPDVLTYVTKEIGTPNQYLYGIASTTYYSSTDRSSVQSIEQTEQQASDNNAAGYYLNNVTLSKFYGLHPLAYEGGPDETQKHPDGTTETDQELANQFAAARDPGMQQVLMHDFNNWFADGGELYMFFSQAGRYSIYGNYPLTEDLTNLNTGKWKGAAQALNTPLPAATAGLQLPTTAGQSVQVAETSGGTDFISPTGTSPWKQLLLNVQQAGTYTLTLYGTADSASTTESIYVDNQFAGTTAMPVYTLGAANSTPAVTLNLSAGLQAVFIYIDGPTRVSFPPPSQGGYITITTGSTSAPTPTPTSTPTPTPTSASMGWTKCSDENGTCSFSGTQVVRYGANGQYFYQTAASSIGCNNSVFGDPIVGTYKSCSTAPVPPTGWTQCATEFGTCVVNGTATVAYGANGQFVYKTVTTSVDCSNATFGDPIVGTPKACYYL
jgi:hypothetical protein